MSGAHPSQQCADIPRGKAGTLAGYRVWYLGFWRAGGKGACQVPTQANNVLTFPGVRREL